jgi:ankyrin repeat protein/WD40 repeat protein
MQDSMELILATLAKAHLHAPDWQQESLTFVPLRGTWFAQSEHSFGLEEEITKFLSSNKKVLLLLGDSGSGKSLYTQGLASKLWQDHKSDSPIPVWISLPSLKNPVNSAVEETFEKFGFNTEQIATLKKTHSFIFILDAFDETHQLKNLWVSNHLDQWKAKIIIACRREYLYHVDNYKHFFTPFNGEKALYLEYDEMIIKPFSEEQIEQYIKRYILHQKPEWSIEQYQKVIEEIPGLKNLLKTPFLLKLAMEALPKLHHDKEQKYMTQAKLCDVFIEQWFIRQEQKLKLAKKIKENEDIKPEFWDYAKKLAQLMHQHKVTQINYDSSQASDLFGEVEDNPWQKFFNAENPKIELLRTACLVREVAQHQYAFIHNSLLEYFLTRNFYETLSADKKEVEAHTQKSVNTSSLKTVKNLLPEDYFNQRLLVKENNTIQFLADRINENKIFKKSLFGRIIASKNNPKARIAASNAITILNRAGISFAENDFSQIHIPEANVAYSNFDHADLSGADLTGINLQNACIRNANFTNATLAKLEFGLYQLSKLNLPNIMKLTQAINKIYNHHKKMLVINLESEVIFWDILQKKLIWKLTPKNIKKVALMCLSNNGSWLAIAGDEENIIEIWDVDNSVHKKILRFQFKQELLVSQNSLITNPTSNLLAVKLRWEKSNPAESSLSLETIVKIYDFSKNDFISSLELKSDHDRIEFQLHDKVLTVATYSGNYYIHERKYSKISFYDVVTKKEVGKPILFQASDNILEFKFSPNGNYLITITETNKVQIWKKSDFLEYNLQQVLNNTYDIKGIEINSQESLFAVYGKKIIQLGNLMTGEIIHYWSEHIEEIQVTKFNISGDLLASGGNDHTVILWDASQKQSLHLFSSHQSAINFLCFLDENNQLFTSDQSAAHYIWKTDQFNAFPVRRGHRSSLTFARVNPSNKLLTTFAKDNLLCAWHQKTGALISSQPFQQTASSKLSFLSNDGTLLINVFPQEFSIWDVQLNVLKFSSKVEQEIADCKFSQKGRYFAAITSHQFYLYDVEQSKQITDELNIKYIPIKNMHFSIDENLLVLISGENENVFQVWDIQGRKCLYEKEIQKGKITFLNSDYKSNCLVTGGEYGHVYLWEFRTGQLIGQFRENTNKISGINFSPNDAYLTTIAIDQFNCSELFIYNITMKKRLKSVYFTSEVKTAWSPGSNLFVCSGAVRSNEGFRPLMAFWDVDAKDYIRQFSTINTYPTCLQFVSDTQLLVADDYGVMKIWNYKQGLIRKDWFFEWGNYLVLDTENALIGNVKSLSSDDKNMLLNDRFKALENSGWSQVHYAASEGSIEKLHELILQKKINPNIPGENSDTPLHLAVENNHFLAVKFLVENKADINFQGRYRRTPLLVAVYFNYIELVRYLLDKNASPLAVDENGRTALHIAILRGHIEIVKILSIHYSYKKLQEIAENNEMATPILLAASEGQDEIGEFLIKSGANLQAKSSADFTVLHRAVIGGTANTMRLFFKESSLLEAEDEFGKTAFHYAANQGDIEKMDLLIKHKANIEACDSNLNTPLFDAARESKEDAVVFLLDKGANAKAKNSSKNTVLEEAVAKGHILVVRCLLEHKTYANISTPEIENLFNSYLLESYNSSLRKNKGFIETFKLLLAMEFDKKLDNNKWYMFLNRFILGGYIEEIKLLLESNAKISPQSESLSTLEKRMPRVNEGFQLVYDTSYSQFLTYETDLKKKEMMREKIMELFLNCGLDINEKHSLHKESLLERTTASGKFPHLLKLFELHQMTKIANPLQPTFWARPNPQAVSKEISHEKNDAVSKKLTTNNSTV